MPDGSHESAEELLWWQRGVVYQIYPRSFQDSNRDGIGDLRGIIRRVPYLSDVLRVDAVWLSPFYPSPMADFGYDVSDYTDVHPMFGTLSDFDELVEALHAQEVRVIIDFVPNHTSDQHPWFQESRSSRDNPRRNWYVWRDAGPDGGPPNNWIANFGGSAWEWDEHTGQYYLHSFLEQQPDLNWRNPDVKEAMFDALRFWLDRGVDGFRIDVAHYIMKDPDHRDNPPNPDLEQPGFKLLGEYDTQLHLYDKGHPEVHGVFRELRQLLDEYSEKRPRMAIGEIHVFDLPDWTSYYGSRLDELHMPFNFSLLFAPWNAASVRRVVDSVEAALPTGAWPNYVLGNHDEHRVASRVGIEQAGVAMMLLLTLRGTPTVYYGDEIGMTDGEIPPDRIQDPWGKRVQNLDLGRDPERTPMQWDESPHAGFCPDDVEPWLPIAAGHQSVNVETETGDPGSMLTLTRRLLSLRRSSAALTAGSYRALEAGDDLFVFLRETDGERKLVALNLGGATRNVSFDGAGEVLISTLHDGERKRVEGALDLRPNEGCVLDLTVD